MVEYRPIPDDDFDQFQRAIDYSFRPEVGPDGGGRHEVFQPEIGDFRGLYDGDRLLCGCQHYWLTGQLRGEWHDVAGVGAVAAPPEHRREGFTERLLAESLAEYRDRDVAFSVLWATVHGFYAKYGWATVDKRVRYDLPPEQLAFATEAAGGEFRPVGPDDYDRLDPVHREHGAGVALTVDRTPEWWRHRVLSGWGHDRYAYAWLDDGEVRGYVVFDFDDAGHADFPANDGRSLEVLELAHLDEEAYLNLLRFCYNNGSQVRSVSLRGPEDTSLLDRVADPRAVDCTVEPGPMFRLVDVAAALEARSYPDDLDAEFGLAVADPLADWNDRTFRVEVADGTATCTATDADPDVRTDVNTLSQVYAGYHSIADATRVGDLACENAETRDLLASLFPPRDVYLSERF